MWTNLMFFYYVHNRVHYCRHTPKNCKCSKSLRKLPLKLRICVRFAAIFNVERVAVLTMTWSYVRPADCLTN